MAIAINLKTTAPPLICLATLFIGIALNAIWPLISIPGHLRYALGSLLIFWLTPRNAQYPSYVALIVLFIGLGVTLSNLRVPILLVPATAIIDRYVIPEEERRLKLALGDQYRACKSQVRRWL